MSNLVIVSGDFCSGSTLLFTLFRETRKYYCLYEPLHELLKEYLIHPLRPEVHDHHFFLEGYFTEFKGFRRVGALFDPRWGYSRLAIGPDAPADDLYRYLSYIIGMGFGRAPRVMFKENRIPFRLAWVRANFPHAKIIHIHRPAADQWKSILRRVQTHKHREDVGQGSPGFNGFNIARWCEDLKETYPELDARHFTSGYDRFHALWQLSLDANRRSADLSIDYRELLNDFEATAERLWACCGITGIDTAALKRFVVKPGHQQEPAGPPGIGDRALGLLDRGLRKYARVRVRVEDHLRRRREG